jgi:S-adenosylmethionine-dependent methyltransferase
MSLDDVRAYYRSFDQREWERLDRADGVIEFEVNTHFLQAHLPSRGRVLDLGGGPGRYAAWLADQGHRVTLADLSPNLLDIARDRLRSELVEEIVEADARSLSLWTNDSFDAALVLGPLYHLPDSDDRQQVVREVLRVTRSGGIVAFALMPLYSLIRRTTSIPDERRHLLDKAFLQSLVERGAFHNDIPARFNHGWGVRPDQVVEWMAGFGIKPLVLASSESFLAGIEEAFVESAADVRAQLLPLVIEAATDVTLLGLAKHLLFIGQTP